MSHRWYVVHAYSGSEKAVADEIRRKAEKQGLVERFQEILIPTEEVMEIKRGQKQQVERKVFPGYILVRMDLDDTTWHLVKDIPKVSGFLGAKGKPAPITNAEAERMIRDMMEDARNITPCTHLLFIAKNLERIGDHCTNIAENVYFLVTGRQPGGERPKVVFCTTENDMSHIAEAMRSGANEYIMKPFDKDVIQGKLELLGLVLA